MEELKKTIKNYIEFGSGTLDVPFHPISVYDSILEELGYKSEPFDNTNGWQVDFWLEFRKPETTTIELSGSLWYGGFKLKRLD